MDQRWLAELLLVSVFGAGLSAVALAPRHARGPSGVRPSTAPFGGIFGLLIAIGVLYADTPFS